MRHNTYKDFLKDPQFILWRLSPDEELNAYWDKYREENPSHIQELEKAIALFSNVKLQQNILSETESEELLENIHISVSSQKKRVTLQWWKWVAAACVIAISSYFIVSEDEEIEDVIGLSADLIIGENLEEQEIYLISDDKTASFSNDIHIELDEHGGAIIREADGEESTRIETVMAAMNKLVVPYGKQSQLVLADGTKVWVNSGSVIEFPSKFTGKSRTVNLIGEMYIEVAKDESKPFFVNTQDFRIKVYGTAFNVSAYNDDFSSSVVLVEGSVGVQTVTNEEAILQPSDMLTLAENELTKTRVDVTRYTSWKDGYIILEQTPIDEVLKHVERFYNLTFDVQQALDLKKRTCTGKLYLSDDLDNVMTTISLLSSTKYVRVGKQIYIDINPQIK